MLQSLTDHEFGDFQTLTTGKQQCIFNGAVVADACHGYLKGVPIVGSARGGSLFRCPATKERHKQRSNIYRYVTVSRSFRGMMITTASTSSTWITPNEAAVP